MRTQLIHKKRMFYATPKTNMAWQAGKSPFFMGDTSSNAGCLSIFIVVFAVVNSEKMEAEKLEVFKISRCHQRFFWGNVNCIRTHIAMYFSCAS